MLFRRSPESWSGFRISRRSRGSTWGSDRRQTPLLGQKSIPPVALDATLVRGRSMDPVMDPMYVGSGGSDFVAIAVVAVFVLFVLLGLMLIHRITRDPDETPDHWRSHRH